MKLNGKKIEGANVLYIVIPRFDGDVILKATAVLDVTPFHQMCPEPRPPKMLLAGNRVPVENQNDERYLRDIKEHNRNRYLFYVIWSLKETEGLEWDLVKLTEPSTWKLLDKELSEAGFTDREQQYIYGKCIEVNGLDESKLEEARARFLVTLAVQLGLSDSLKDVPEITPSGELANASA